MLETSSSSPPPSTPTRKGGPPAVALHFLALPWWTAKAACSAWSPTTMYRHHPEEASEDMLGMVGAGQNEP
jgi:hypothetical protein